MSRSQNVVQITPALVDRPEITDPVHLLALRLIETDDAVNECDSAATAARREEAEGKLKRLWEERLDCRNAQMAAISDLILYSEATTLPGVIAQLMQLFHVGEDALIHEMEEAEKDSLLKKFRFGAYSMKKTLEKLSNFSSQDVGSDVFMPARLDPCELPSAKDLQKGASV